jgi:glycerophosphoryl diester phosphodiesterase
MPAQPLVIAHAACKGHAPENTLAGIRAALALGADAIEIDVHCTADRVPVLCHDATVDRTTDGTGAIADLTLEWIRALDAGCRVFDGRFAGERIPTLAETLDLTRGRCLLIIEIKAQGIEREVVEAIGGATDDVMAWSFQPGVVQRMRELAPAVPCALLSPPLAGAPGELSGVRSPLASRGCPCTTHPWMRHWCAPRPCAASPCTPGRRTSLRITAALRRRGWPASSPTCRMCWRGS